MTVMMVNMASRNSVIKIMNRNWNDILFFIVRVYHRKHGEKTIFLPAHISERIFEPLLALFHFVVVMFDFPIKMIERLFKRFDMLGKQPALFREQIFTRFPG